MFVTKKSQTVNHKTNSLVFLAMKATIYVILNKSRIEPMFPKTEQLPSPKQRSLPNLSDRIFPKYPY